MCLTVSAVLRTASPTALDPMYDLKLPPVATFPDCTDAEEFLRVPSTKRQRNGGDGRYTPRSPGPSTPSEETTSCCPSPASSLSRFSCSPRPEPVATEVEWELHDNSPVATTQGCMQRFMSRHEDKDEACFGMIQCRCNSTVQHVRNLNSTASHKLYTALVTVTSTTKNTKTPIAVHLLDHATPFGILDRSLGAVLLPLLNRSMMRIQAVAPLPLVYSQSRQKEGSKATVEIFLNIFGSLEFAAAVGEYLSSNAVYLQHPKYPESGYCYKNPQIFSTRFDGIITETTSTGGVPAPPEDSIVTSGITAVLDLFNNVFKSAVVDEMSGGSRLKTDLMRQV
ncbi:hypothetical protein K440DRAFT_641261 [Wilcoxina mikolae CBS 423.85]|nr:hypothetical protein K440DRAFT_641261 [Wilcoxina mikolae CBS 423.85]